MLNSTLATIVSCLAFTGTVLAQPPSSVQQNLDVLLEQWNTASVQMASMPADEQRACGEKMAACAAKCPVGSRMGDTLAAVNAALSFSVVSSHANEKYCPLANAETLTDSDMIALEMKTERAATVAKLHTLSSYAAAMCTDDASRKAACEATIATGEATSCCPIQLASRIGALKAGLVQAQSELESLSAADQVKILNDFGKLSQTHKAVAIMPQTIAALHAGLEDLQRIDAAMGEWAQSQPKFMSQVPQAAMQSYMIESALLTETRELMTDMTRAMSAMQKTARTAAATR